MELEQEWHPTKNGDMRLADFTLCSAKKVWWKCSVDARHEWEARIFSRTKQGAGCPYCKGKKVLFEDSLAAQFPSLLEEWNYSENTLDPKTTHCKSGKHVWWRCSKGHAWRTMIRHRTEGRGCPFCSNQKACLDNSLLATNSPILKEWHPTKNTIDISSLLPNSHVKVWWKCDRAEDHEWEASVANRMKGNGCPCCAGRKVVKSNCLATTHPSIADEWHPTKNKNLTPYDLTYAANKRAWFRCKEDLTHEWSCKIHSRTRGDGCPFCASSKGEKAIKECLDKVGVNYRREYKLADCMNKRPLPFDFAVLDTAGTILVLIEFQGRHHYTPVEYFGGKRSFEARQRNDNIKLDYCTRNNIELLVIPYTERDRIETLVETFLEEHAK